MQNIYPLFEHNRILKKELLEALRDYSFLHTQIEYQEYGPGILRGCDIRVENGEIIIGPGIIKYGQMICLMKEGGRVAYEPVGQLQYLKIKIEAKDFSPAYRVYEMKLVLDTNGNMEENEFELCRFHLKKGAKLRTQYTCLSDMETEYDTVNPIYASWGGLGGPGLSPVITRYFAERILESDNSSPEDRSFALLCLSQPGAVPMKVLSAYMGQRIGGEIQTGVSNTNMFHAMCTIADQLNGGIKKNFVKGKGRHMILVD